ncbi:MAG: M23 family metallopeptidase [Prolixibacteraceae bacterium]|nr:M23 family metallopeptidase [Prolixibacteraceae bacterium]
MRRTKYHFNPNSLSFEQKKISFLRKAYIGFGFFVLLIASSAGISMVYFHYFDTPETKALVEENNQLVTQYNALNEKLEKIEAVLDEIQVRDDNIYRVIFEKDPIPESVRKAGFGGTDRYAGLESLSDKEIVLSTAKKVDIVSKQAYIQAKSYEEVLNLAIEKELELSSTPAIMPISNHDLTFTSSGWGMRVHPVYKVKLFHWGMDFVAPRGTAVYATGDGVVESTLTRRTGHGKHIVVDHGYGYKTLYAHLNKFNVVPGQKVKRGQIIGYVGSTGTSTAPHLHYEVEKNNKKVDPKYYFFKDLTPEKFDQLVAISSNIGQSFD